MINNKDSLGNELTKEQIEYFKDTKIVDKDNNLLVVYHGSPTPTFREFDPRNQKSQFGKYKFGDWNVNYFTTDKRSAASYTEFGYDNGTVYECYVNITNPYIVDNKTEAEIKSHLNIKDDKLRQRQIELFDRLFNKWKGKIIDTEDYRLNELNRDLKVFNLELRPCDEGDGEYCELFDLYDLGKNSFFGAEHPLFYQYYTDELFSDDMYEELKNAIIGEDPNDYYFSTDDIVRYVISLSEQYDGIIIKDIHDSKEMFSDITTDVITLLNSSQIKAITNKTPTRSDNIDEEMLEEHLGSNVINKQRLLEVSRNQLVNKSKKGKNYSKNNQALGKNRWERKRWSRVAKSTREFNSIDMNAFFKKDILTVNIPVQGETDNYIVKIKFKDVLNEIAKNVQANNNKLDYRIISQALSRVFNSGDVYCHCTCPDWMYRMAYWSTVQDYNSGQPESRPNRFTWTNSQDDMGGVCKHAALVLANVSWLMKVASVINNYIHYAEAYMQRQFADIIFPKIYGVKYPEALQLGMFDRQYLRHSKGVIDAINEFGSTRGRFKKKPKPETNPNEVEVRTSPKQISIFDLEDGEPQENNQKSNQAFKQQTIFDYGVEEPEDKPQGFKPQRVKQQPKIQNKGFKKMSIFDDEFKDDMNEN